MRRSLRMLATTVAALALMATQTAALPAADARRTVAGGIGLDVPILTSDNVDYVLYLPLDVPAVSGALREVDGQRLFFVWGMKGLSIYDVDQPELPILVGHLHLPASQNEDMQVSADGTRAIIAADGGSSTPIPVNTGLHIVDTSDPADPVRVAHLTTGANHTAHCADDACEWVYGNRGSVYHVPLDLTGPGDITVVTQWLQIARQGGSVPSAHALNRTTHADGTQIMISDSTPRVIMDVTDPSTPVVLARGRSADHQVIGARLQHNNQRPDADLWEPRDAEDPGPTYDTAPGLQDVAGQLRPGELMISGSETNATVTCPTNPGKLTTWSIANFDRGADPRPIATLRPESSLTFENGNPPANAQGCSNHWFDWIHDPAEGADEGSYLLAAGWYEHGVRVIAVDHEDYSLEIVGYAQLAMGSAASAYWVPEAAGADTGAWYIYAPDYRRGLHVLRYRP